MLHLPKYFRNTLYFCLIINKIVLIKMNNSKIAEQLNTFQQTWTLDRLQTLSLDEYTNTLPTESFCYWIEHKLDEIASIKGGSSYKFGIYKRQNTDTLFANNQYQTDGIYAWLKKYGATKNEAFDTIKQHIVAIVRAVQNKKIQLIDDIDMGTAIKWKIAFSYAPDIIIPILKTEKIRRIVRLMGMPNYQQATMYHMQQFLYHAKPPTQNTLDYATELLGEYEHAPFAEEEVNNYHQPEQNFWLLAAGEKGEYWQRWIDENIVSIGWGFTGNLALFYDEQAVLKCLIDAKYKDTKPTNNARACFDFAHRMQLGDYVFAKRGTDTLLGLARITGNYEFSETSLPHQHLHTVEWLAIGDWKVSEHLPIKTLTDVTPYYEQMVKKWWEMITDTELSDLPTFELAKTPKLEKNDHLVPKNANLVEKTTPKPIIISKKTTSLAYTLANAMADLLLPQATFEQLLRLLQHKKNLILQGPPGVGKTFIAQKLAYCFMQQASTEQVITIQFHASYGYEDFLQGFRPNEQGQFVLQQGIFYKLCQQAKTQPQKPYFLIIEEINRGNIGKIFGEVLLLIEANKRGQSHQIALTYTPNNTFFVPDNVYLIGTMNTADRSLALVDYALRRRFAFYDLVPQFNETFKQYLTQKNVSNVLFLHICTHLNQLNQRISNDPHLGKGYQIGHSYFCNPPVFTDLLTEKIWFNDIIDAEISPLLHEYWFDQTDLVEQLITTLVWIG